VVNVEGQPQNLVLYNTNVRSIDKIFTIKGQGVAPRFYNPGGWGGVVAAYLNFSAK